MRDRLKTCSEGIETEIVAVRTHNVHTPPGVQTGPPASFTVKRLYFGHLSKKSDTDETEDGNTLRILLK